MTSGFFFFFQLLLVLVLLVDIVVCVCVCHINGNKREVRALMRWQMPSIKRDSSLGISLSKKKFGKGCLLP